MTSDNQLSRLRAEADDILGSLFGGSGSGNDTRQPEPATEVAPANRTSAGGAAAVLEDGTLRVVDDDLSGRGADFSCLFSGADAADEAFPTLSAWARNGAETEMARRIRYGTCSAVAPQ
eukprot:SAG31_NODE_1498_length_8095_cov_9.582541_5_plen_119_part_00